MVNKMKYLQEKDLKYIWHPCSQMKDYEAFPPNLAEQENSLLVIMQI